MASKKEGGGSKLARSQVVTVRLDPKLRFAAELAARKQRRTVSSFIEWAIEKSLQNVILDLEGNISVQDVLPDIWDVDYPDRFAKLALRHPDLLTHDEQIIWKLICENGYLWKGSYNSHGEWSWRIAEGVLIFERVRENFETFEKVAKRELDKDELPTWPKKGKPKEIKTDNPFDTDDIPF